MEDNESKIVTVDKGLISDQVVRIIVYSVIMLTVLILAVFLKNDVFDIFAILVCVVLGIKVWIRVRYAKQQRVLNKMGDELLSIFSVIEELQDEQRKALLEVIGVESLYEFDEAYDLYKKNNELEKIEDITLREKVDKLIKNQRETIINNRESGWYHEEIRKDDGTVSTIFKKIDKEDEEED